MKLEEIAETDLLAEEKVFSVSEFLDFINEILLPKEALVQGEIGEKVDKRERYTTFNLIDKKDKSVLKCFIWNDRLETLGALLEGGLEVKVFGNPKIFKSQYGSEFEFEVKEIWLLGEGALKQAFEALKRKLQKEGLFDERFKKPIPKFCQKIGLITSRYGKGAKPDFEKHLGNFGFKVFFFDARVEGIFAISDLVFAIRWFNENMPDLDVLVLIRGGGDWESLRAFNSEEVARAIFASKIPVICGVGHESDLTIADLVADKRASTPTDAAKILTKNWEKAQEEIKKIERNLNFYFKTQAKNAKRELLALGENLTKKISNEISEKIEKIDNYFQGINFAYKRFIEKFKVQEENLKINFQKIKVILEENKKEFKRFYFALEKNISFWKEKVKKRLFEEERKLLLSSPKFRLRQGYTITLNKKGKVIKRAKDLKISEEIITKFFKGQAISRVKKIENKNGK
jgi:exodeoxyribonuclease VII large subunit